MLPKIKDSISVVFRRRRDIYEVNFLFNASSVIAPFEFNKAAFSCLRYLDGQHTLDEISSAAGIEKQEVKRLVASLRRAKILCSRPAESKDLGSSRFASQLNFFAEFETAALPRETMQNRLTRAHVAVVGIGGIGSWVVFGLTLAGVGQLTLIDADVVELSNLNRQCLFTLVDVGKSKVDAITSRCAQINADIRINAIKKRVSSQRDCIDAAQDADLIINCADEPTTDAINRIVTKTGHALRVPHLLCGGYDGHLSFLGPTVIPGKSACWCCYEHALDRQRNLAGYEHLAITPSQVQGGNIGPITAITANYHVLEAIKVLTGFANPALLNRAAELDFLTFEIHFRTFERRRSCAVCGHRKK